MWLDDTNTTTETDDATGSLETTTTPTTPLLDTLTPQQKMNTLLSVDAFKNARPNMVSFTDNEIQECINTSMDMLDALCGGLISQVCGYNVVDDRTTLDTKNSLYRTDFQMSQLTRAFIIQTQYTLNLGNDFSIGSTSMSTGGLNGSFQRPVDRDIYAPGVKEALRLAGVYIYQAFGLSTHNDKHFANINDLLTRETADGRYVQTYQKNGLIGAIAQIDKNLMVSFVDPSSVSFNITQAQTILDPQNNTYQPIDKVSNIAWISGPNKNVDTPQEVDTKIQDAINNVPQLTYISFYAGEILAFATDNDYQQFKNETGTTDDDFRNLYVDGSTWIFKSLGTNIESTALYLLDLDQLPEFRDLKNQVATNTTNIQTNTDSITALQTQHETDIENLQNEITTNANNIATNKTNIATNTTNIANIQKDYVTTDTTQTITAAKTFSSNVSFSSKLVYVNNGTQLCSLGYVSQGDIQPNVFTISGPKVIWVQNIDTTSPNFGSACLVPKSYVDNAVAKVSSNAVNWTNIQAPVINFNSATSITVPTTYLPQQDNQLVTKAYVDNLNNGGDIDLSDWFTNEGELIQVANNQSFRVEATSAGVTNEFWVQPTQTTISQPINVSGDVDLFIQDMTDATLAPKKYVDNQIASVNNVDWDNIQAPTVNFATATDITASATYTPQNDNSLVTKSYVDNRIKNTSGTITDIISRLIVDNSYLQLLQFKFSVDLSNKEVVYAKANNRKYTILQVYFDGINTDYMIACNEPQSDIQIGDTVTLYYYE